MPAPPTISDLPHRPIDIDAGIAYPYVIPVQGETSLNFTPDRNFTLVLSGRTLTVTYIGIPLTADKDFNITVTASNAHGHQSHTITFRIHGAGVVFSADWTVQLVNGREGIDWNTSTGKGSNAAPHLRVGRKVRFFTKVSGTADGTFTNATFFVKRIGDRRIWVSATLGGAVVVPAQDAVYQLAPFFSQNASDQIYVRDTSKFVVGRQYTFTYNDGTALPTNLSGAKYVKDIVDGAYLRLSDTLGGAALVANADSFPADDEVLIIATESITLRMFPAITSGEQTGIAFNGTVSYDITSDIAADSYQVDGLPAGTALAGAHISGTPTESGFFPVILIANKGEHASYRYWLLIVGAGATGDVGGSPDVVLDLGSRGFYSPGGIAGRADRLEWTIADRPIRFAFQFFGEDAVLPSGTVFRFALKNTGNYSALTFLIYGTITLTADATVISASENWSDAAFLALFANQTSLDFLAQAEWKLPTDTSYTKSKPILARIYNNMFRADTAIPGALPSGSPVLYMSWITRLTGGVAATDLDAQPSQAIPERTLIIVETEAEGETHWRKEIWEGAPTPGTDLAAGRIQPTDYHAVNNNYVLIQKV